MVMLFPAYVHYLSPDNAAMQADIKYTDLVKQAIDYINQLDHYNETINELIGKNSQWKKGIITVQPVSTLRIYKPLFIYLQATVSLRCTYTHHFMMNHH